MVRKEIDLKTFLEKSVGKYSLFQMYASPMAFCR